jgi:hypothetical protein
VTRGLPELVQSMILDMVNQPPPPPDKMKNYPRLKKYIERWSVRKQLVF